MRSVIYWNVRSGSVTTEAPDELDVPALVASMNSPSDMEAALEEVIMKVSVDGSMTFEKKVNKIHSQTELVLANLLVLL